MTIQYITDIYGLNENDIPPCNHKRGLKDALLRLVIDEEQKRLKIEQDLQQCLNALKALSGIEAFIVDEKMKQHFQKTVYPIIRK